MEEDIQNRTLGGKHFGDNGQCIEDMWATDVWATGVV